MSDWKKEASVKVEKSPMIVENDTAALAILAAAMIRQGMTRSVIPREAALMLAELKKYHQENLGG